MDLVAISGAANTDFTNAFIHDYKRQTRPMNVFSSAGLNDILKGSDGDLMIGKFIQMNEVMAMQNSH